MKTAFSRASLLLFILAGCEPRDIPKTPLATTKGAAGVALDDCVARERCVIAYVAPWCGACRATLPFMTTVREKLSHVPGVGVKVIAGADQQPRLDALAKEIGGTVYFDPTSMFFAQAGGGAVPHWWVVDREGKILTEFAGSPGSPDPKTVDWFIRERLELPEKF